MEIYLVGGAVRDNLLGITVKERDWAVVGGTPAELESQGYLRVGKSFPVFLHPQTSEEYALARTETKTGEGYHGFDVYAGTDVSLEDDLLRRDLTINAIAQDAEGNLIDPYHGQQDLHDKILRHVSLAFREDPLRVLRVARFAAAFHDLGFSVAEETQTLLREMADSGELNALVPERVWKETEKALGSSRPDVFFARLRDWGALEIIYPEVDRLFGIPQPERWHPEIDTGEHVLMVLRMAAQLSESTDVRFAALVHDLGKGTTPESEWPQHRAHEQRGVKLIKQLCDRIGAPNRCRELGQLLAKYHTHVHRAEELRPQTVARVLDELDAYRRPDRFEEFLVGCEADARGRKNRKDSPYPQAELFRQAFAAAKQVDTAAMQSAGLKGAEFGKALDEARQNAVRDALRT